MHLLWIRGKTTIRNMMSVYHSLNMIILMHMCADHPWLLLQANCVEFSSSIQNEFKAVLKDMAQ